MKTVVYTDENGWMHKSIIRNNMPNHQADLGIMQDPPDLLRLNWEEIAKELNNLLVQRDLITLKDVSESRGGLANAIQVVMLKKIIALYKEQNGFIPMDLPKKNGKFAI